MKHRRHETELQWHFYIGPMAITKQEMFLEHIATPFVSAACCGAIPTGLAKWLVVQVVTQENKLQ
eukprot:c29437_g1_i1 orf=70-264(+)